MRKVIKKSKKNKESEKTELIRDDIIELIKKNNYLLRFFSKNLQMYRYTSSVFTVFTFTLLAFLIPFYKSLNQYNYSNVLILYAIALVIFIGCTYSIHIFQEEINLFLFYAFDENYFKEKEKLVSKIKKIRTAYLLIRKFIFLGIAIIAAGFYVVFILFSEDFLTQYIILLIILCLLILIRRIRTTKGIKKFDFK